MAVTSSVGVKAAHSVAAKTSRVVVVACLALASTAYAQAPDSIGHEEPIELKSPAEVLRASMDAATAGDWATVGRLMESLLRGQLGAAELAEAHRLAGLAAFFEERKPDAERHFLAYLQLDLDGQLDAALYPPDVIVFFTDVKSKYNAELRARRPKQQRYWQLSVLPPVAQFQNGDRTKGWLLAGALVGFVGTNLVTYGLLTSWCDDDRTCDPIDGRDRTSAAAKARVINLASGIGAILTFAYGVYDGVSGYRRDTKAALHPALERTSAYISSSEDDVFVGVAGSF
ncbi:MAG: hypothetical protein ACKV2T_26940 [Kofleriaceae bacterium]